MNKIHLLWKIPVFLIILVLLINIFDFVGITKIKIVDSITGEPLENIKIRQDIRGGISRGPAGSDDYIIRILEKSTDSKGTVTFPLKFHIHIPIFKWFNYESVTINQHARDKKFNYNYYSGFRQFKISHLLPFKSKTIGIIPYVDDISECKQSSDCVDYNSNDLAYLTKDESYCKNIIHTDIRESCYRSIAVFKANKSLCNKIAGVYQKNLCINNIEFKENIEQRIADDPVNYALKQALEEEKHKKNLFKEDSKFCNVDSDCVPNLCCNPFDTVNKKYTPDCNAMFSCNTCENRLDCVPLISICENNICGYKIGE